MGLPPSAITIAKLKKHREKIIEKTANKLCLIIGISNLKILPKKLKFKIWCPLDLVEKSYGDHFFHFQQPLVASNDLRGLQALEIQNLCVKRIPKWYGTCILAQK